MPNPSNKQELVATMADGYAKLNEQIAKMSEEAISATFDFAADPKKCGVRWQYDRCLRDLLIHLYEWQVLMREFVNNIREGHPRDYLPDEYRKNYHEMDKMLVEKHQKNIKKSHEHSNTIRIRSHHLPKRGHGCRIRGGAFRHQGNLRERSIGGSRHLRRCAVRWANRKNGDILLHHRCA